MLSKKCVINISIILILLFGITFSIYAETKYNPYTGEWETASPNSQLKYNPFSGEWKYASPDAGSKYNPNSGEWETVSPNSQLKYNPFSGEWEYASPDAGSKYNPYSGEWETASPNSQLEYNPFSGEWKYTDSNSNSNKSNNTENFYNPYQNLLDTQKTLESLPTQIYLKNETDETIWTSITYLDVDNQWQTKGWWKLKPNEEAFVAQTHNRYFYVYAVSGDGNSSWGGSDYYNNVSDSKKVYGFVQCEITRKTRKFTQSFND